MDIEGENGKKYEYSEDFQRFLIDRTSVGILPRVNSVDPDLFLRRVQANVLSNGFETNVYARLVQMFGEDKVHRFALGAYEFLSTYRLLLQMYGLDTAGESEEEVLGNTEVSPINSLLSAEDTLYNLVVQGNVGDRVFDSFKYSKKEKVQIYAKATEGLRYSEIRGDKIFMTPDDYPAISAMLEEARSRYYELWSCNDNPNPGLGGLSPKGLIESGYLNYSRFSRASNNLIKMWVKEPLKLKTSDNLATRSDLWTYKNISLIMNLPGIQFRTQLSGITPNHYKGAKGIEISVFTTKNAEAPNSLEAECRFRQAQLILFSAERYIESYIIGNREVAEGRNAVSMVLRSEGDVYREPNVFASLNLRHFNKQDGSVTILKYKFTNSDREEFASWLLTLGNALMLEKELIKYLKEPTTLYV